MKNITPIQVWKNGETKTATKLDAKIVNDDLQSSCLFYWQLIEADQVIEEQTFPGKAVSEGNSEMSGQDYLDWDGSNDAAYSFVAGQINVVIVTE